MPVTYVIKFDVVPEQRANFLRLLGTVLDAMRDEPTFQQAVLHRDPTSEYRFKLYETWASHEEVLNVQLKRSYRNAWHEALPGLLVSDRDIEIWEPLRSDHR
ncbi:putative quinol monooxygenase [Bradyrhizobium liaoningense]|uniref:putative quinol monooxygenase n=1 Tax=Bradyrhizobium liaoningense TaxID=43992 RepID=UPI001BA7B824|nr:putative quinol monooxygenase [Bradyrhizobium liaoningense]MBR0857609.1 antibiotic biosynthesis monooxygenase [Bradyrhizobium liaoningense]